MKILFIVWIVLFSCQSQQTKKATNQGDQLKNDSSINKQASSSEKELNRNNLGFIDSIKFKLNLTSTQIKNHTLIDSIYYSDMNSDVRFTGDTIFNINNEFKAAIIEYDDRRSCIYKFLLVLGSNNKNLSNKIIYTDCDRDESSDYSMRRFKLLSDSTFETIETYISANNKSQKIKRLKFKFNKSGMIESLN